MHEDVSELKADVKEIKADMKVMNETLLRNTYSLEVHMARTDLAEKRLDRYESHSKWVSGLVASGILAVLIKLLLG
jgi:hypothetical protein